MCAIPYGNSTTPGVRRSMSLVLQQPIMYEFEGLHIDVSTDWLQYSETRATSKWGIFTPEENPKKPWIDGVQNWPAADQALAVPNWPNYEWKYGGSIGEAVNRMLSPGYHTSWESFASTRYHGRDPIGPGYLSLEFIHNQIHVSFLDWRRDESASHLHQNFSGGSDPSTGAGHMSTLAFAAFDPLFWLHHW